jgi:hypothetical protein
MRCRVNLSQLANRITTSIYQGQAAGFAGNNYNYSYTLSDTIPANMYWLLVYASLVVSGNGGNNHVGMWAINPGVLPTANKNAYQRNNWFFQGDIIPTIANGPPVGPYAYRIDQSNDNPTESYALNSERVMLKSRRVILPPGTTLLGYGGASGFGLGGGIGEQFRLKIAYAVFDLNELAATSF